MLCMCTPAGLEDFFMAIGDPVESSKSPPPTLSEEEKGERLKKAATLAPNYRIELLKP
jgi:hypothetical protein